MDKLLILNKIQQYYNFKNDAEFAKYLEIPPQNLSKWKSRNTYDAELLYTKCTEINAEFLLTGNGDMIKGNKIPAHLINDETLGIPLVGVSAIGGFGGNAFAIMPQDVKEYYKIPKFSNKRIDFMIEVEGSSMYPKYNSGDIVACTVIKESKFIQWNKTHVVATQEQGIIIKRVKKGTSDDSLCMVSDNTSYDPFEVPKDEINGIALVVGVIRLE